MTRILKILLPIVFVVAGIGAAGVLIKGKRSAGTRPPGSGAPLIRVIEVEMRDHQFLVHSQGTVMPRTEITLVAEAGGRIIEVSPSFVVGGFFSKGDLLARVEPVDYEAALATAQAGLRQAELSLEMEKATAEVSRKEWEDLGLEETNPLALRELQVQEAESRVRAAQAGVDRAHKNLDRTRIAAPFDGRLREKFADLGQFLAPGTPVARVYAVDYVEVRLPVPGEDAAFADFPLAGNPDAKPNTKVELAAQFAGRTHTWTGEIVRTEGTIDPLSRMMYVVARVSRPYEVEPGGTPLAVGMFAQAVIQGHRLENVVLLPRGAVRGRNQVVIVDSENRLRQRNVNVLRFEKDEVVIGSGLEPGERVLVSPLDTIIEGMLVRTSSASPQPKGELGKGRKTQ